MELTTVLGGIKPAEVQITDEQLVTPVTQSPVRGVNTTPKDQERFVDVPDVGPKKLLTPIFQKQLSDLTDGQTSGKQQSASSQSRSERRSIRRQVPGEADQKGSTQAQQAEGESPLRKGPTKDQATPDSGIKHQLDYQLQELQRPSVAKSLQIANP